MQRIIIGYMADHLIGDPYWLPHPIRFIGLGIKKTEAFLRNYAKTPGKEKGAGVILVFLIVGLAYGIPFFLLKALAGLHPYLAAGAETFMIFQILAAKSLDVESRKVYTSLDQGELMDARKFLSYIVGRDTQGLSEREIIRGTVETVAENTSDGVIAPLFFICIGGAPLGMAYKAINTLDSMVGYKNEQYLHFGWAGARLDDIANYIPARLTALYLWMASMILGYDWRNCIKILMRDRKNHKSPNSGYPEAAVAGALGIQIGGTNTYFGQRMDKPTIGDPKKDLEKKDILGAIYMMYVGSTVGLAVFLLIQRLWVGGGKL